MVLEAELPFFQTTTRLPTTLMDEMVREGFEESSKDPVVPLVDGGDDNVEASETDFDKTVVDFLKKVLLPCMSKGTLAKLRALAATTRRQ